jgi:hypothetical protein
VQRRHPARGLDQTLALSPFNFPVDERAAVGANQSHIVLSLIAASVQLSAISLKPGFETLSISTAASDPGNH